MAYFFMHLQKSGIIGLLHLLSEPSLTPSIFHTQEQERNHRQCMEELLKNTLSSTFTPLFSLKSLEKGCHRAIPD